MSQTDKEARLANKALVVDPAATGESESLSTKEAAEQQEPEMEQAPETSESTQTPASSEATGDESNGDRANREHDAALRAQYDRTHEVAAAGGDNGENEVE